MSRVNVEKVARLLERYVNFPREAWLPSRLADIRIQQGHRMYRICRMRYTTIALPYPSTGVKRRQVSLTRGSPGTQGIAAIQRNNDADQRDQREGNA